MAVVVVCGERGFGGVRGSPRHDHAGYFVVGVREDALRATAQVVQIPAISRVSPAERCLTRARRDVAGALGRHSAADAREAGAVLECVEIGTVQHLDWVRRSRHDVPELPLDLSARILQIGWTARRGGGGGGGGARAPPLAARRSPGGVGRASARRASLRRGRCRRPCASSTAAPSRCRG